MTRIQDWQQQRMCTRLREGYLHNPFHAGHYTQGQHSCGWVRLQICQGEWQV